MDFDLLYRSTARQQLMLLGGVEGSIDKAGNVTRPVLVLIERDLQFPADNGLSLEYRTVATLLREEVGKVADGNKVIIGTASYKVTDPLEDDGYVVKVFVRGPTNGATN